jgi:hypothetical protein
MINVHLIGAGRWSKKISEILSNSKDSKYLPVLHSTEEFHLMDLDDSKTEIIWLTLFPERQIEKIKELKNANTKIVLEKPFYLNTDQRIDFIDAISGFEGKFWPSIPWQFGAPWLDFLQTFEPLQDSIKIEIIHSGEPTHRSIPFSLDWFSHDVPMIVQIFRDKSGTLPDISRVVSETDSITIFFSDGSSVKFTHKISKISEYKWHFEDENHFKEINFLDFDGTTKVLEYHPIVKMLDYVVRSEKGFSRETLKDIDSLLSILVESELESGRKKK